MAALTSPRPCPVCLGDKRLLLHQQRFSRLSSGSLLDGYDVVTCEKCGAIYADNIPGQDHFDRYYAEMSKYEYTHSAGAPNESAFDQFRDIAGLLAPYLESDTAILDIGCATGGLLSEFKRCGFQKVTGVDPSPACSAAARKLYDILVHVMTITGLDALPGQYGLILLTGVLEHVRDIDAAMVRIRRHLKPGGLIFIEVPDSSRYECHFSAPYQYFSMEHVNFFSAQSLANFMARHGFHSEVLVRKTPHLTAAAIEPTVGGLFRFDDRPGVGPAPIEKDNETVAALRRYLDQSAALDGSINSKINELVDAQVPLAVWGVGTHTLRLLETSRLAEANITAFLDSNTRYQGKLLHGRPILDPATFRDASAEILISSQVSEQEIWDYIHDRLAWTNKVHRLYPA